MLIASAHTTLPDEGVPEWVHLVPAGTFRGADGRGPYRMVAPQAVIDASMAGGARLPIDENHATDHAMRTGQPSPARGWIDRMEARPDGLWGHVEWTEPGHALMTERAYRGLSPVFAHTPDGVILKVLRAALTNTPNLTQLTALHSVLTAEERDQMPPELFAWPAKKELPIRDPAHVELAWDMVDRTAGMTAAERREARSRILARARQLGMDTRNWQTAAHAASPGDDMDPKAFRAALGLPETATEADILAAVTAHAATAAAHATALGAIAAAAGVAAWTTEAELVTALQAQRAGVGDAAQLSQTVVSLQAQLQTLQAGAAKERAIAFVDGAIRAGKPIVPLRDRYIARHTTDAANVEAEVNALPSIHAGGIILAAQAAADPDEDPLTDTDMHIARQMGLDPKAFAKHRRAQRMAREREAA